jgi:hypothetical protein
MLLLCLVLVHNIKATIMTPCLSLIKTARRPYPNTYTTPRRHGLAVKIFRMRNQHSTTVSSKAELLMRPRFKARIWFFQSAIWVSAMSNVFFSVFWQQFNFSDANESLRLCFWQAYLF